MKFGVSFATTTPLPRWTRAKCATRSTTSGSVSGVGIISNSLRYRGGLKKCVPRKRFLKSSERPSAISPIGRPDVFVEITAASEACSSIRFITDCLMSIRSTTTSITQSTSAIFSKSSSKLPKVTRFCVGWVKNGAGFIFVASLNAFSTIELGAPSFPIDSGVTSRRRTSSPAFARWAAICEPITPAPSTAAVRKGRGLAAYACWPFVRV